MTSKYITPKSLYSHIYKLLYSVTPIGADCGKLCNAACCKGDEDTGMYLFPYEECMFTKQDTWLKIYNSDFIINNEPVKIAICDGKCNRRKRPLSCRIFPLFQIDGKVMSDMRAMNLCPLVTGKIELCEYDSDFVNNVKKVFNILGKFNITSQYIKETQKIINEAEQIKNIFLK